MFKLSYFKEKVMSLKNLEKHKLYAFLKLDQINPIIWKIMACNLYQPYITMQKYFFFNAIRYIRVFASVSFLNKNSSCRSLDRSYLLIIQSKYLWEESFGPLKIGQILRR